MSEDIESLILGMTKAQHNFLDQMTRKLLVDAAASATRFWHQHPTGGEYDSSLLPEPYRTYALSRGWVSKRNPCKLTGKGFGIAASFLKR